MWSDRAQHAARSNNLLALSSLYTAGAVSDTNTDRAPVTRIHGQEIRLCPQSSSCANRPLRERAGAFDYMTECM